MRLARCIGVRFARTVNDRWLTKTPGLRALMLCALCGQAVAVDALRVEAPATSNQSAVSPAATNGQQPQDDSGAVEAHISWTQYLGSVIDGSADEDAKFGRNGSTRRSAASIQRLRSGCAPSDFQLTVINRKEGQRWREHPDDDHEQPDDSD